MKKMQKLLSVIAIIAILASTVVVAFADEIDEAPVPVPAPAPAEQVQPEPQAVAEVATVEQGAVNEEPAAEEPAKEQPAEDEVEAEPEEETEAEEEAPVAFTGSVEVELVNTGDLYFGDEIILRAKVQNANVAYKLRWEFYDEEHREWKPIQNETKPEYRFIVTEENAVLQYRVVVIVAE